MSDDKLIKNIPFSNALTIKDVVDYKDGQIVSMTIAQNPTLSITLFAIDEGEEISTHTTPGDALVQVLDGEATITIDGKDIITKEGEAVVMPADVPHALNAHKRFKMLLTVVKRPPA